jgi:hypothetical protein
MQAPPPSAHPRQPVAQHPYQWPASGPELVDAGVAASSSSSFRCAGETPLLAAWHAAGLHLSPARSGLGSADTPCACPETAQDLHHGLAEPLLPAGAGLFRLEAASPAGPAEVVAAAAAVGGPALKAGLELEQPSTALHARNSSARQQQLRHSSPTRRPPGSSSSSSHAQQSNRQPLSPLPPPHTGLHHQPPPQPECCWHAAAAPAPPQPSAAPPWQKAPPPPHPPFAHLYQKRQAAAAAPQQPSAAPPWQQQQQRAPQLRVQGHCWSSAEAQQQPRSEGRPPPPPVWDRSPGAPAGAPHRLQAALVSARGSRGAHRHPNQQRQHRSHSSPQRPRLQQLRQPQPRHRLWYPSKRQQPCPPLHNHNLHLCSRPSRAHPHPSDVAIGSAASSCPIPTRLLLPPLSGSLRSHRQRPQHRSRSLCRPSLHRVGHQHQVPVPCLQLPTEILAAL